MFLSVHNKTNSILVFYLSISENLQVKKNCANKLNIILHYELTIFIFLMFAEFQCRL